MGSSSAQPVRRRGAWDPGAPWVPGTTYQAPCDGVVCAHYADGAQSLVIGLTDSATPASVVRNKNIFMGVAYDAGICMPVKKDDYWQVANAAANCIFWIPWLP